jgi:hypothetical protein
MDRYAAGETLAACWKQSALSLPVAVRVPCSGGSGVMEKYNNRVL